MAEPNFKRMKASGYSHTWEEAVSWLRNSTKHQDLCEHCYFDDPHLDAAMRFWSSDEWSESRKLLPQIKGDVLDIGAGRGISSFAFAKDGWRVTALEPNQSPLVGAIAISHLFNSQNLPLNIHSDEIEQNNLPSDFFDVVYCRQTLHHAKDIHKTCKEVNRVLKRGGYFLATREHVVDNIDDLQKFLDIHPLHSLYGGEYAYSLREYLRAIEGADLSLIKVFHPYSSIINTYPLQPELALRNKLQRLFRSKKLDSVITLMSGSNHSLLRRCLGLLSDLTGTLDKTPGRLYSFWVKKK